MATIKVKPRNKKEKSLIKTFFKALNLEIEEIDENKEISNPIILERVNKLHNEFDENNYITIDPKNLWESMKSSCMLYNINNDK